MLTISFTQFRRLTKQRSAQLEKVINNNLPVIIGRLAVNFFTESFQNETWGRKPWKEVKRRQSQTREYKYNAKHHPARTTHKILTGNTGSLGRSLKYEEKKDKVTIYSDLIYAAVHNYGLRAGRGKGFTMPKRQFIGKNKELIAIILKEIEQEINKVFH
jgi:phage gpG-like protein